MGPGDDRYSDHGANLYEAFDAIDGDHETVAAALFDPIDGDLAGDLEERYPLILGDVLLCERTWIKPQYRGHKLGLLIKAMSISALGRGCGIAVTYPAPFEGEYDDGERDRAIRHSVPTGPSSASSISRAASGCSI